jgi:hypothetical protein
MSVGCDTDSETCRPELTDLYLVLIRLTTASGDQNGKWQMANGKWQMANGKWQMTNDK